MNFDLWVHITGLCLFTDEDGRRMHVLMPRTGRGSAASSTASATAHDAGDGGNGGGANGHGGSSPGHAGHSHGGGAHGGHGTHRGGTPLHALLLTYDVAHEHPDRPAGRKEYVHVNLNRRILDLTGLRTADRIRTDLPLVLDIDPALKGRLPRTLLGDPMPDRVAARVSLAAGGVCDLTPGHRWTFDGGEPKNLATRIGWRIGGVEGEEVATHGGTRHALRLRFTDEASSPGRILFPIDGKIDLHVLHVTPDDVPPLPVPDHGTMPHFEPFLSLGEPLPGGPWPQYEDAVKPDVPTSFPGCAGKVPGPRTKAMAGRTAACFVVRASLAPAVNDDGDVAHPASPRAAEGS